MFLLCFNKLWLIFHWITMKTYRIPYENSWKWLPYGNPQPPYLGYLTETSRFSVVSFLHGKCKFDIVFVRFYWQNISFYNSTFKSKSVHKPQSLGNQSHVSLPQKRVLTLHGKWELLATYLRHPGVYCNLMNLFILNKKRKKVLIRWVNWH